MSIKRTAWFIVFAFLLGCKARTEPIRMQGVPLPEGGHVTSLAHVKLSNKSETFAIADDRLFVWSNERWQRIADEGQVGVRSQIAGFQDRLLVLRPATISSPASIISTRDRGENWTRVELPPEVRAAKASTNTVSAGAASIRATDDVRFVTLSGALFLIHARNVWEGTTNQKGILRWRPIDLTGLPFGTKRDSRLPPVVRSFLNSRGFRPFEMTSVLSEQLLIYRRETGEVEWTLVSTLPYAEKAIIGAVNSDTVFVVADQTVHRSDDGGERWFQFWPIDAPRISTAITVPDGDSYVLIVAGRDGSIWRSPEGGGNWEQTVGPDGDQRHVHRFIVRDEIVIGATTGRGVLASADKGKSFGEVNGGLIAARPFDLSIWKGEPIVATVAGVHRWASDKNRWTLWTPRASSAVHIADDSLYIGTFSGDLLEGDSPKSTKTLPKPFRGHRTIRYERPGHLAGEHAVLSIAHDPVGGRLVAWSARHGGAVSTDGSWLPLDLDKRLLDVLAGGTVESFVVTSDAYFLLERTEKNLFRLWRSDMLASRWAEVHRFEGASNIEVFPIEGIEDGLWAIEDGKLSWSSDAGDTFSPVVGPWKAYRVVAVVPFDGRTAILAKTPRRIELYFIDGASDSPGYVNHPVLGTSQMSTADLSVAVDKSKLALSTADVVLVGSIPTAAGGVSLGASIALAGLLGLILTALVFVIARARGGNER